MKSDNSEISRAQERVLALDGFRGLAILLVTFYRFGEVSLTQEVVGKLPSKAVFIGASGVDFFFVLSGFLITGILLDASKTDGNYFKRFYFRRVLRIFPLYYVTLFVLLVLLPSLLGNTTITDGIRGETIHLWTYTVNLSIAWHNSWNYGALDHFWSLAIEEQFYLFWPIIVYFVRPIKLMRWCIGALILLALSRALFSWMSLGEVTEKSFTLFRLDGLLLGATAAMLVRQHSSLSSHLRAFRLCLMALMAIYVFSLALGTNDYSVRYFIVSGVGTALLLTALAGGGQSIERRVLENPVLRYLGKVSYAMYVFQAPLIPLLSSLVSPESLREWLGNAVVSGVLYVLVMFAITFLLAIVSWVGFEKWFLKLKHGLGA